MTCLASTTDPWRKKKTKKEEAVDRTTETSGYLSLLADRYSLVIGIIASWKETQIRLFNGRNNILFSVLWSFIALIIAERITVPLSIYCFYWSNFNELKLNSLSKSVSEYKLLDRFRLQVFKTWVVPFLFYFLQFKLLNCPCKTKWRRQKNFFGRMAEI